MRFFLIFFDFFFKNHVSRPLPLTKSLHWREFDPVEIEATVIDIRHREDMAARLQRNEQRTVVLTREPDVPPVVLRVRPAARTGQEERFAVIDGNAIDGDRAADVFGSNMAEAQLDGVSRILLDINDP